MAQQDAFGGLPPVLPERGRFAQGLMRLAGRNPTAERYADRLFALQEQEMMAKNDLGRLALDQGRFNLRAQRAEMGALAGMGMPPGVDATRLSQITENLAQARANSAQARSISVDTMLKTQTVEEMMDSLLGKQTFATGVTVEDQKTAMRVNKATENAQATQMAQLQDSFMAGFEQIQEAYRQQAGDPRLDLFGLKDAKQAVGQMQQLLAGNPMLTPEAAFRQVYAKAAGLARNKFLEISGMGNDLRSGGAGLPAAQAGPEGGLFQKGLLEMMRKGMTSAQLPQAQQRGGGVRFMLEGLLGMDQTPPELGVGLDRTTTSLNRSLEGLK